MNTAPTATDPLAGPRFSHTSVNHSTGIEIERFYVDSTLRMEHKAHSHLTISWADRWSSVYDHKEKGPLGRITDPSIVADLNAIHRYWMDKRLPQAWHVQEFGRVNPATGKRPRSIAAEWGQGKVYGYRFAGALENYDSYVLQIMKDAIKSQLKDFKEDALRGGSQILCENACGTWLNRKNIEVDHEVPLSILQRWWIEKVDERLGRPHYKHRRPSRHQEEAKTAYYIDKWAAYHQRIAGPKLRLLCISCNQTLGKELGERLENDTRWNWI